MHKILMMIALAAILMTSAVHAQMKVAIFDFKAGVGVEQADVNGIAFMFGTYFINPQRFTLVERTQIDKVISEQGFQQSSLTEQQMVKVGQILNIQNMVIGYVNILNQQYNVDVRVVDVQSGAVVATEGATVAKGSSYREQMQKLATNLMNKMTAAISASTPVSPGKVVILFDYLYVYPNDIGEFTSAPVNVIASINRNSQNGFNNWRIPSKEELDLMRANSSQLGLKNGVYMTSDGIPSGIVRLVRTEDVVPQTEEIPQMESLARGLQRQFPSRGEIAFYYAGYDAFTKEQHGEIQVTVTLRTKIQKTTSSGGTTTSNNDIKIGGGTLKEGFSIKVNDSEPGEKYLVIQGVGGGGLLSGILYVRIGDAQINNAELKINSTMKNDYDIAITRSVNNKGITIYNFVIK